MQVDNKTYELLTKQNLACEVLRYERKPDLYEFDFYETLSVSWMRRKYYFCWYSRILAEKCME